MKLERCLTGTLAEMQEAQAAVDKALGYPKRGYQVGGGIHVVIPETWDGQGECPPGWAKTASEPVLATDGTAYLAITGEEANLIEPKNLARCNARERQVLARVGQAQELDLKAIISAAEDAKERRAENIKLATKVAIGVTLGAAAAAEVAHLLGVF